MAKIYYRKYKERIDSGELTVKEAIQLAKMQVPTKWRDAVVEMLNAI